MVWRVRCGGEHESTLTPVADALHRVAVAPAGTIGSAETCELVEDCLSVDANLSFRGAPTEPSQFRLRTLLIAFVVVGAALGVFGRLLLPSLEEVETDRLRQELFRRYPTIEALNAALEQEFRTVNPPSIRGWRFQRANKTNQWNGWRRRGIAYYDRNNDGKIDMKYRYEPRTSTNEYWWEDSDFDGDFDTEVQQGCFHHNEIPLTPKVAVPRVIE